MFVFVRKGLHKVAWLLAVPLMMLLLFQQHAILVEVAFYDPSSRATQQQQQQQAVEDSNNGTFFSAIDPNASSTTTAAAANVHLLSLPPPRQQQQQHVIFYHVFIPAETGFDQYQQDIVTEQMLTMAAAAHRNWVQHNLTTRLYYNVIWKDTTATVNLNHNQTHHVFRHVANACQRQQQPPPQVPLGGETTTTTKATQYLTCHLLAHYSEGFEDVTLQDLWTTCRRTVEDDYRPQQQQGSLSHSSSSSNRRRRMVVTYLHNKGSFRRVRHQQVLRRSTTRIVLNEHCIDPLLFGGSTQRRSDNDDDECNLCGNLFFPTWGPFLTANFWSARCDYVAQLIAPRDINRTQTALIKAFEEERRANRLLANYQHAMPFSLGIGRYGHELWVGGHPAVRPCDTSDYKFPDPEKQMEVNQRPARWAPMAPRKPVGPNWYGFKRSKVMFVLQQETYRMREYFLLPGYLFRTWFLYQQLPPATSWVWKWFPDGKRWYDEVTMAANATETTTTTTTTANSNGTAKVDVLATIRRITGQYAQTPVPEDIRQQATDDRTNDHRHSHHLAFENSTTTAAAIAAAAM